MEEMIIGWGIKLLMAHPIGAVLMGAAVSVLVIARPVQLVLKAVKPLVDLTDSKVDNKILGQTSRFVDKFMEFASAVTTLDPKMVKRGKQLLSGSWKDEPA